MLHTFFSLAERSKPALSELPRVGSVAVGLSFFTCRLAERSAELDMVAVKRNGTRKKRVGATILTECDALR